MTLGLDALVLAVAAALYACGTGALGGLAARPLLQAVLTPALPWLSGAAAETRRSVALGAAWNGVATCAPYQAYHDQHGLRASAARHASTPCIVPVHRGCPCVHASDALSPLHCRCALTTWAMSFAQKTFAASTAALAYALEPCFAIGFAALLLHESATRWQLAGGALVVLSNLLASIL